MEFTNDVYEELEGNIPKFVGKGQKYLDQYKVLELNADLQPRSYFPLSLMTWQDVMFLLVKGEQTGEERLTVIAEYDDVVVRSAKEERKLPSVVAHTKYIKPSENVAFTRFNVFLRDDFTCQYTGKKLPASQLTFDHVIPKSQGGKTTWENIVTASTEANLLKADKSLKESGLKLIKRPYKPSYFEMKNKGRKYPPKYLHESWLDYLYWTTELDE